MADILIRVKRPEGYEDVHPELVLEDMNINPGFDVEVVSADEPVAWMWQHEETGMTGFVQHAPEDELRQWERMNKPRKIVCPLFRHPAQVGAKESSRG